MNFFKVASIAIFIYPSIALSGTSNPWMSTDKNNVTLYERCGNGKLCEVIANEKYFAGVLKKQSGSNCPPGELFIVDKSRLTYKSVETGTCNARAYVSKGTYPDNILASVDVILDNERIKIYPIGQWSMAKDINENGRPGWGKVKKKERMTKWNGEQLVNYNRNESLTVKCYINRSNKEQSIIDMTYINSAISFSNNSIENVMNSIVIDGKEYPVNNSRSVFEKESTWSEIFKSLRTGKSITVKSSSGEQKNIIADSPMENNTSCSYR